MVCFLISLNVALTLITVEDLERNDGSVQKPYFMSKNLMKILNKSNKAPKKGKGKKWRSFYLLSSWSHTNTVTDFQVIFTFSFLSFSHPNKFTETNLLILHFFNDYFFNCVCAYVVLMTVHMEGPSMWIQVMWHFKLEGYFFICLNNFWFGSKWLKSQNNCSIILNFCSCGSTLMLHNISAPDILDWYHAPLNPVKWLLMKVRFRFFLLLLKVSHRGLLKCDFFYF